MSKIVKTYRIEDMEELDYDLAPSLDIPSLHVDHVLMPKDGAKYNLFNDLAIHCSRSFA